LRKLVTIQSVKDLIPIEGADFIELCEIMGWRCVVKKGEFSVSDLGVYFEVDSFLPIEARYEFLRKSSYYNNSFMGEGFRIRTAKFKGHISQGLFLPLKSFPEIKDVNIGDDVTDLLNVRKWELPEVESSVGIELGDKPYGIPTTDEVRIQSAPELCEILRGNPYYITTKMDGTSCTMYYKDGVFGVCGRNKELKDTDDCGYWNLAKSYKVPEKLTSLNRNIALQGEYCGHGIQKNRLKLFTPKYYIFDAFDLDNYKYLEFDELKELIRSLELDMVPIEEEGESFSYDLPSLLERARGKYSSGLDKEGIVIRSKKAVGQNRRISFKVINNDFLLKEK